MRSGLSKLIVNYRLKSAVKQMGDNAPVEVGVIAEQLVAAGFPEFVIHYKHGRTLWHGPLFHGWAEPS
ncbi:tail fiber domain-containing protein [Leifsonia sp. 2MCAF36]|uniref:tail fiber domain-containing protein n=1 Tax=Leifsonia sp. 2MCAF36 TaxID=3232988 RepID=UPI003F96D7AB